MAHHYQPLTSAELKNLAPGAILPIRRLPGSNKDWQAIMDPPPTETAVFSPAVIEHRGDTFIVQTLPTWVV